MGLADVVEPLVRFPPRHGHRNVAWGLVVLVLVAFVVGGGVNFVVKVTDGRWGELVGIASFTFSSALMAFAAGAQTTWGRPVAEQLAARKG